MKKYFYADSSNTPQGPFTLDELRGLAANATINATTMICAEGDPAWTTWAQLAAMTGAHSKSSDEADPALTAWVQSAEGQPQAGGQPQTMAVAQVGGGQASQAATTVEWGSLFRALLMIILKQFTLPYELLRKSALDLTEWGSKRTLPSSRSDLPVMTFIVVVMRPLWHLILTVAGFLAGLAFLLDNGRLTEKLPWCMLCWVAGYFGNVVLGFFFDSAAVFVQMANSLKRIETR
jgi:hypothetical protein